MHIALVTGLTGSGLVVLVGYDSSYKTFAGFSASQNLTGDIIFSMVGRICYIVLSFHRNYD